MSLHKPRKVVKTFAELLELPQDIVMDQSRLTIIGNYKLLIENHKGIIEYTAERIRIKIGKDELLIGGSGLALSTIQVDQILVEGTLSVIRFE